MAKERCSSICSGAKADPDNVVLWADYRVTVLGDRLFRVEKSEMRIFRDDATQCVWFRNADKQSFTFADLGDSAEISTKRCKLVLKRKRRDCRISLDGGAPVAIDRAGNLRGTYRTLDACDGRFHIGTDGKIARDKAIALGYGVCSLSGVAVISDEASLSLTADGKITDVKGDGTDEYVFAFGKDYRGAVKALYDVCGYTPLVPRFALGNWWSRYHAYTQEEYMRLVCRFRDNGVPITVATIDMDWHWSDFVDEQKGISASGRRSEYYCGQDLWCPGWTGYSWNTELFPDYKGMLRELKDLGLKVTLNIHPAQGVRYWEDMYGEMARAMNIDPASGEVVRFDITDEKFVDAYFRILHEPYEKDGVDFWWIDWQQGEHTKIDGLDPLWALNHYHYLHSAKNRLSPLILSRYAGIGSHRYPLGFSGDTIVSWRTLAFLPYFTLTATNAGYTWWSHDVGGHYYGEKSDELFVRHLQFGVFSPINRLHCVAYETMSKEPWFYGNGAGEIAIKWLKIRHSLIPFLYTCSYLTHRDGAALIEPLYYRYDESAAYRYKDEYIFGRQFIVAPVVTKRGKGGYSRTKVWIPEGVWTDIFTGDRYRAGAGGKEMVLHRTLDSIPVLMKEGGILVQSADEGNSCDNPVGLLVTVRNGDGEFDLYEDGRERGDEREFFTRFASNGRAEGKNAVQTLLIRSDGEKAVIPTDRKIKVVFADIEEGKIEVKKDGKRISAAFPHAYKVTAEIPFEAGAEYEINVLYAVESEIDFMRKRMLDVLLRAEEKNVEKVRVYNAVKAAESVSGCVGAVLESSLGAATKARAKEVADGLKL